MGQKRFVAKYFEAVLLLIIVAIIWLAMFLPVILYFLVSSHVFKKYLLA
jgi:hypothetical protein